MLFATSDWAIRSKTGLIAPDLTQYYKRDNHENFVEKKTDVEEFEIIDEQKRATIKKNGNRISYEITIFDLTQEDIDYFNKLDGCLIDFYPNFLERPDNFQECYFHFIYDDCTRSPIHFVKLFLKRKRLEKLGTKFIPITIYTDDTRLILYFNSISSSPVNLYLKLVGGAYTILKKNIEIKQGNNYIDFVHGLTGAGLDYMLKVESVEDFYLSSESQAFKIV